MPKYQDYPNMSQPVVSEVDGFNRSFFTDKWFTNFAASQKHGFGTSIKVTRCMLNVAKSYLSSRALNVPWQTIANDTECKFLGSLKTIDILSFLGFICIFQCLCTTGITLIFADQFGWKPIRLGQRLKDKSSAQSGEWGSGESGKLTPKSARREMFRRVGLNITSTPQRDYIDVVEEFKRTCQKSSKSEEPASDEIVRDLTKNKCFKANEDDSKTKESIELSESFWSQAPENRRRSSFFTANTLAEDSGITGGTSVSQFKNRF